MNEPIKMKEKQDTWERISERVVKLVSERALTELSLGFMRYEALRKLNPPKFAELHWRNIKGERFDDMVDELVVKDL